ncbi:unnamed protein product [Bursaphelenchus okinawaensis]|uniref:Protein RER1 n=1 Tax=Bursaphelenchus okinawaensis TaxID=465554 RepID=A0A811K9K7_9BILA|nr:unnamed protein product [Bursaphelenchus okinawaensis]CAG9096003.1 unnamed protein product [Bursaphelenchus okinawaensis]
MESDIRDAPAAPSRFMQFLAVNYQHYLDRLTPYTAVRWTIAISFMLLFCYRVFHVQGFYIVTYALFIFYLNLFLQFLSPKIDPAFDFDSDDDGPALPQSNNEEFRPFMRRLPEFKFWLSTMKATILAFTMTFFEIFDIPVFWPILVMYFFFLTFLTLKRQIMHMIKYRYIPFTFGKPRPGASGKHHQSNRVAPAEPLSPLLQSQAPTAPPEYQPPPPQLFKPTIPPPSL